MQATYSSLVIRQMQVTSKCTVGQFKRGNKHVKIIKWSCNHHTLSWFSKNNVILNLILLQEWSNPPNTDFTMIHQMANCTQQSWPCSVLEVKPNNSITLTKIIIYWTNKLYLQNKVPVIFFFFFWTIFGDLILQSCLGEKQNNNMKRV